MKRIILSILAATAVLTCAASCSDNLKSGIVDLTPDEKPGEEEEFEYPSSYQLNHPCALVTSADIDRVKNQIALASPSDPVYVSYTNFCKSPYAQAGRKAFPVEIIIRGDATGIGEGKENYGLISEDAASAYQLALRWRLTGETKYADDAVRILNAWVDVCKKIDAKDNNQYLCAGFQGYTLGNAGELLRDYEGWEHTEQNDFKTWLRNVWIAKNEWFIDNHGGSGVCDLHYWSNWELANLASMLAIGIYLEDYALITKVYRNFREGKGSGCINNIVPFDPISDPDGHGMIAQSMESGRDQGHATLVASMSAELCKMAWNIGRDFWGMNDNRMLAMFEYTAKYNVMPSGSFICVTMPFTHYSYCPPGCGCSGKHGAEHDVVSADGRGKMRPCWEMIYDHYVHNAKLDRDELYYVKLFADQLRYTNGVLTGDGGSGDSRYGNTSAAFDQIGWGTMMFYRGE